VAPKINRKTCNLVGFWKTKSAPKKRCAKKWTSGKQKRAVLAFIKAGTVVNTSKGWANCRLCGAKLGCSDLLLPTGNFLCPAGFEHYIEKHGIKPPKKFIDAAVTWYTETEWVTERPYLRLIIDLRSGEVVSKRFLKTTTVEKKS